MHIIKAGIDTVEALREWTVMDAALGAIISGAKAALHKRNSVNHGCANRIAAIAECRRNPHGRRVRDESVLDTALYAGY